MKITVESTDKITTLETESGAKVPARVWEGKTESGIFVQCLVTRIAAHASEDLSQFERELQETKPPTVADIFPLRMII